jgi:hypothetical protein
VADDRRAAQALEDAELDLVRLQRPQLVEAFGKALHRLAGQAGDQVDVHVGVRLLGQPADVVGGLLVVLLAADQRLHRGIEALDADLELQRAGREFGDAFFASGRWSGTSSKWA